MNRKTWLGMCFSILCPLLSHATGIEVVRSQSISFPGFAGPNFAFTFSDLPAPLGESGSLTLHASGDFVHRNRVIDGEHLSWNLEDVMSVERVGNFLGCDENSRVDPCDEPSIVSSVGGPFDFVDYEGGLGAVEFQRTYEITAADLHEVLNDGAFDLLVDWKDGVNSGHFMAVTLRYASVPEPDTVILFGLGASCLLARRRQSRQMA